jgi:hypothetical protein
MSEYTTRKQLLQLAKDLFEAKGVSPTIFERVLDGSGTSEDRSEIIGILAAELCENGLDGASDPTVYGKHLENIIDIINRARLT